MYGAKRAGGVEGVWCLDDGVGWVVGGWGKKASHVRPQADGRTRFIYNTDLEGFELRTFRSEE